MTRGKWLVFGGVMSAAGAAGWALIHYVNRVDQVGAIVGLLGADVCVRRWRRRGEAHL